MTRRASNFKETDVKRAVKAAITAGISIHLLEITREGSIRIFAANQVIAETQLSAFDSWKAKQNARSA